MINKLIGEFTNGKTPLRESGNVGRLTPCSKKGHILYVVA
jgi:hypothetical protein